MATTLAKDDFHAVARSFFEDGKFSDFTIICNGKEYHVYCCFVAPRSKYFERACTGMFKEGAECKIELKEDYNCMVDRMGYYFYNFDYYNGRDRAQPTEPTPWRALWYHIQMYSIADKCDVPGLQTLALGKFKASR